MEIYVVVTHCFGRLDSQAPHMPTQFLDQIAEGVA